MSALENLFHAVIDQFALLEQPWALVGGLAVSVRTEPRFTRDLDIAIAVEDDQSAEEIVYRLLKSGYRFHASVEQSAKGRLATARLVSTSQEACGLMLDLLFASSGIEKEICRDADPIEVFKNVTVPVATISHLIVLKVLARDDIARPQDAVDLRQLILAAHEEDFALACKSARLVEERGFHRERNLVAGLTEAWQAFRPA